MFSQGFEGFTFRPGRLLAGALVFLLLFLAAVGWFVWQLFYYENNFEQIVRTETGRVLRAAADPDAGLPTEYRVLGEQCWYDLQHLLVASDGAYTVTLQSPLDNSLPNPQYSDETRIRITAPGNAETVVLHWYFRQLQGCVSS